MKYLPCKTFVAYHRHKALALCLVLPGELTICVHFSKKNVKAQNIFIVIIYLFVSPGVVTVYPFVVTLCLAILQHYA